MLRIMFTGAVLALAMPAVAQDMPSQAPAGAATPAAPSPADAAAQAAPADNQPSQVASIIEGEYPVYDADKSGELSQDEFSKWLTALKEKELQATGKTMAPQELTAWAGAAFQTADADKNGTVSKAELSTFLGA